MGKTIEYPACCAICGDDLGTRAATQEQLNLAHVTKLRHLCRKCKRVEFAVNKLTSALAVAVQEVLDR